MSAHFYDLQPTIAHSVTFETLSTHGYIRHHNRNTFNCACTMYIKIILQTDAVNK